MPVPALVHRQIADVIQRPRKPFQPQLHLLPVDVSDVQPFGAAVQLAGVLGDDNDAYQKLEQTPPPSLFK